VDDVREPMDSDGHGTRIVSLLLRIAPKARIHVSRVAKDVLGLQSAEEAIARVCFILTIPHAGEITFFRPYNMPPLP
jgi:hypothetical protein